MEPFAQQQNVQVATKGGLQKFLCTPLTHTWHALVAQRSACWAGKRQARQALAEFMCTQSAHTHTPDQLSVYMYVHPKRTPPLMRRLAC
eukprot:1159241-Pelagomonas_calceolata.AAC.5